MRRFRQGRSAGEPPAPIISGRLSMTQRIFDGLKVIDCASFIAGPAAATVMSDFGAEIIKIEPPGKGDPYRRRAVPVPERPLNPGFILDGRNKKSLALDLRAEAGRAVLYRLVRDAGAFVARDGRPPLRDGHVWRDCHRALPARAHRQGQLRQLVAAGEWPLGQ